MAKGSSIGPCLAQLRTHPTDPPLVPVPPVPSPKAAFKVPIARSRKVSTPGKKAKGNWKVKGAPGLPQPKGPPPRESLFGNDPGFGPPQLGAPPAPKPLVKPMEKPWVFLVKGKSGPGNPD